jgi:Zn-dependent protease with chaperone function
MKEAEYEVPSSAGLRMQRIVSLIVLMILVGLEWNGWLYGGIRMMAIQAVATGVIWFVDGDFYEIVSRRCISYRFVAWIVLIGLPLVFNLLAFATSQISS